MTAFSGEDALLSRALKDLETAFAATAGDWRDATREDFARMHLEPIAARTREAEKALAQLAALVQEAERRCR